MRVHHQKNPQTKNNLTKIQSTRKIPTTEPRMHRILGGRTAAPTRRKTGRATNAGSSPKKSANKKTTSQKSNPRAKSHHGAADAPHPRRSNSRSTPKENKSRNECGCITKKNPRTKTLTSPKSNPRAKSHHGAADAPHSRRPNSRSNPQENRSRNECGFITKKSANKKPNLTKIQSTRQIPTTEPRNAVSRRTTAAPTRRKTSRATNAGSSPKKIRKQKTISQKSNPRAKSPPRSRGTQFLGGPQPLQPAGKQVAQRMQVHHQKNPQTKNTTSPKSNPRAKSHHGAAERSFSAVEQPLQPAGKQVAQRMRVHNSKKSANKKKQPPKNSIHAQNPHHGAADAPHPRRSNSRSNQQENKSRNECGCRCILQNREIC